MKKISWFLSLALFLAILLFTYSFSFAQWQYEDIISNPSDDGGEQTDMQADSSGNLHLVYYDGGSGVIRYAFKPVGSINWFIDSTFIPTGKYPHLFVDRNDTVHICYYAPKIGGDTWNNSGSIYYAKGKIGSWTTEIAVADSVGPEFDIFNPCNYGFPHLSNFNDILVNSNGKVYIAYFDSRWDFCTPSSWIYQFNANLAVRESSGTWKNYVIDGMYNDTIINPTSYDETGEYENLLIDENDKMYISHVEYWDGAIRYGVSTAVDSVWNINSFTNNNIDCPGCTVCYNRKPGQIDLTLKKNNKEAILSYVLADICIEFPQPSDYKLFVARVDSIGNGTLISKQVLDQYGQWPVIATKDTDTLYIAYYRTSDNTMRMASSYDGGVIYNTSEIIESSIQSPGRNPTMVLWNDTLHLVYYDLLKRSPRYAWKNIDSTSWHLDYVTKNLDAGEYLDYAVVDSDSVHLAYYDNNRKRLFYGAKSDSVWSFETVDSIGDVGMYCKIQLVSDSIPQIAYYDRTNGDLKLATQNFGVWNIQRIDSTDNVGTYCSFRVDKAKNDTFHIAYYDETNSRLRYAKGKGTFWMIENVDNILGKRVGQYASLELDSAGRPHIAYMEVDSTSYGKLRYIYRTDTSWTAPQVVDANPGGGKWNSLKFNRFGKPVIAHTYDFGGAKEVHCTYLGGNGYWGTEKISKPYLVGHTSLHIAEGGQYFITYAEQFNSSVPTTVQMIQRDMNATTPSWSNFPITNNIGAIGLSSKLFISDNISNDTAIAYIIGKKSATLNKGIAKLMFTPFVVMNDTSEDNPTDIPEEKYLSSILLDNYPNPFSSSTSIRFYLPHSAQITLRVYNLMGQMVNEIARDKKYSEGIHEETFTARALPSGIYFYEIITPQKRYVQKMLLMK